MPINRNSDRCSTVLIFFIFVAALPAPLAVFVQAKYLKHRRIIVDWMSEVRSSDHQTQCALAQLRELHSARNRQVCAERETHPDFAFVFVFACFYVGACRR